MPTAWIKIDKRYECVIFDIYIKLMDKSRKIYGIVCKTSKYFVLEPRGRIMNSVNFIKNKRNTNIF